MQTLLSRQLQSTRPHQDRQLTPRSWHAWPLCLPRCLSVVLAAIIFCRKQLAMCGSWVMYSELSEMRELFARTAPANGYIRELMAYVLREDRRETSCILDICLNLSVLPVKMTVQAPVLSSRNSITKSLSLFRVCQRSMLGIPQVLTP